MQHKKGTVTHSAPLGPVLREIIDRLVADDWVRCATDDESSVYYIIGARAHDDEQTGGPAHMSLSIPSQAPTSILGEHQVHGQVASNRSSAYYINRAVAVLVRYGVDHDLVADFVKNDARDLSFIRGCVGAPKAECIRALTDLLEAMMLAKGLTPAATEAQKRSELSNAVEKLYLWELSGLYMKLVERASSLEVLDFLDPQLNEASRCFLYGFFRGAVILSASAVETSLRAAVGRAGMEKVDQGSSSKRGFFNRLVDEADSQHILGPRIRQGEEPPLVCWSRRIFKQRTRIVHPKGDNQLVPERELRELAAELLIKARKVLEHLHERRATPPAMPA